MLQKIIDILYRSPKYKLKTYSKFGGYFNKKKIDINRKMMESAAFSLSPVLSYENGLPIYFLTGQKYLYQTLFCIYSLSKFSSHTYKFYLIDDGSFTSEDIEKIKKLLPNSIVYTKEVIDKQIQSKLPEESFPHLRYKRKIYPHIKKLTDIHIFDENEWKLVLDSDMLFWREPIEVINWLKNPTAPIYMLDCGEAYGYSIALMQKLANSSIKPLINVGIVGLKSSQINWKDIEYWCKELEIQEGTSYYLEQAISAMIIADKNAIELNRTTYVVNPLKVREADILHHYVDTSKELYFKTAWKEINNKH